MDDEGVLTLQPGDGVIGPAHQLDLLGQGVEDLQEADGATPVHQHQIHLDAAALEDLLVGESALHPDLDGTGVDQGVQGDESQQGDAQEHQLQVVDEGSKEDQHDAQSKQQDALATKHLSGPPERRWN